jgi:hypothetical protein
MGHLQVEPHLRLSALICVQENDLKDLEILVNADKGGFSQIGTQLSSLESIPQNHQTPAASFSGSSPRTCSKISRAAQNAS